MSHKTKNKLLSLKQRLVLPRALVLVAAFLASTMGIGLAAFEPVYAQTQAEATECYERYNDNILIGTEGAGYRNSGCKFEGGQGNCLTASGGDFGKVRCSQEANTEPVMLDSNINNLDECAKDEDLSFDWGTDCVDTPGLINIIFGVLASLVGVAVVGGIAWGGMLYTTSNGNSAKAQQGITVIVNSVIGLLLFIFLFAITNFLIPGGVFRS